MELINVAGGMYATTKPEAKHLERALDAYELVGELVDFIRTLDFANDCTCPFERKGKPIYDHEKDCREIGQEKVRKALLTRARAALKGDAK